MRILRAIGQFFGWIFLQALPRLLEERRKARRAKMAGGDEDVRRDVEREVDRQVDEAGDRG